MDAETLAALKASIQHWRDNVAAKSPEDASTHAEKCGLCVKFNKWLRGAQEADCADCPVARSTGQDGCGGTPYDDADEALDDWRGFRSKEAELAFRAAAQAELDFLIGLLPEGETA